MSVQALAWVLENSQAELGARLVLIAIANHADQDGEKSWPSVETIAHEARLSERQVYRALRTLIAMGELSVIPSVGGRGKTNRYVITAMQRNGRKSAENPEQMSPFTDTENPDICDMKPCHFDTKTLTFATQNPDQMSPEPSLTVLNRQEPSARADARDSTPPGVCPHCGKLWGVMLESHLRTCSASRASPKQQRRAAGPRKPPGGSYERFESPSERKQRGVDLAAQEALRRLRADADRGRTVRLHERARWLDAG